MSDKALAPKPAFLDKFVKRAEAQQEALASQEFTSVPWIRIGTQKEKGSLKPVVEIHYPEQDEAGNKIVKTLDSLRVILMAHTATRSVSYKGADDKFRTECFSVGSKKDGVGIGTFHDAPMACSECQANWEKFDTTRSIIAYGSDTVTRENVICGGRHKAVVLLDPGSWTKEDQAANQPTLAMMELSMSSVWGISTKKVEEAYELDYTLLAYPMRNDPEKHKGILHRLLTRPWELGQEMGLESKGTDFQAIWLTIEGGNPGTLPRPVHMFDLAEEATLEELEMVDAAGERANNLLKSNILQELAAAAPPSVRKDVLDKLATVGAENNMGEYQKTALVALPMVAEFVDEPRDTFGDDGTPVEGEAPPPVVNEFPPEPDDVDFSR